MEVFSSDAAKVVHNIALTVRCVTQSCGSIGFTVHQCSKGSRIGQPMADSGDLLTGVARLLPD